MHSYDIPLIIRGKVIASDPLEFEARRGLVSFRTPDVKRHFDELTLRSPDAIRDLYAISLDEIIEFLDALSRRLSPEHNMHIAKSLEMAVHTSGLSGTMMRGMYRAMGPVLRADSIREIVRNNIGADYLNGWQTFHLRECDVAVRAFGGRFVHLNAGNGPSAALYGVINGSLLRADNIIKSPSNDPYTSVALVRTMIDMAPDHPVTRHFSVAYWKGGDSEFEEKLYGTGRVDKIIAWGGESSMKNIRRYIGPGLDLVALDPKISASIIGNEALKSEEEMDKVAGRLARDVGYLNQEGCVASRVTYIVSGTTPEELERLNRFGKKVNRALQALPEALSTPHPSFDPTLKDEIDGIRYSPAFRVFGCRENEGGVIVSQVEEPVDFRDSLACRVVNIVPVASVDAAVSHVTVHTQTIGIYPRALKEDIRDRCLLHGAQRLTDLGCATFAGLAYPHDGIEIIRRMARWGVMETFNEGMMEKGAGLAMSHEHEPA